jgi:3-oxoacyl-[acyl-carrier-protein] synthase I
VKPIAILGAGMITGVGLTAPAACAAMRAGISGFRETRFMARGGEWVVGAPVPLPTPWRGRTRLARLAASVVQECLASVPGTRPTAVPLLLCVAEPDRPGRPDGLDADLLREVQALAGVQFHPLSQTIARGRVGGAAAVDLARRLIRDDGRPACLVAGVDSYLVGATVVEFDRRYRLLTDRNSDGFIPGEAAAAVLVGPAADPPRPEFQCLAIGFGREPAPVESGEPLRADGLVAAYRTLGTDGGVSLDDADYRYTDCNGEQYYFKDDRLAYARTVRKLKARFDHLHPADSVGEIGAAVGPCVLALALAAARGGYAPGDGVVCHFGNDDGDRAAMLLRRTTGGDRR